MRPMEMALVLVLSIFVGACSSLKKVDDADSMTAGKFAASYLEKTDAVTLDNAKVGDCPTDGWESVDWKKAVAFANACVKAKDWVKVDKIGNHLAIQAYLTPWGPYFLSLSAAARKDYPRAQWLLELASKKAPQEGIFHYQLGRLAWENGDEAVAIKELTQASDMNSSLVEAQTLLGLLAYRKQDNSTAERRFQKALEADPTHWPAMMGLASVKIKNGNWKEAEELLVKSVKMKPASSKARLALAQVQETHLQKLSDALQTYKDIKSLSAERKLDEGIKVNLEEKIQSLEKSLSQAQKVNQVTVRKPAEQKRIAK